MKLCIIYVKLSHQTEIKSCICVPLSDKWVHFCGKTWNQIRVRILAAPLRAFVPPAQPVYGLRAAAISGAAEAFLSWKNKSSSVFVCSFTSTCGLYTYSLRPLSQPPCKRSQTQRRRRAAAFKPKSDHVSAHSRVERSAGNTNTQHVSATTMHPIHRLLFWKIQYFPEGQLRLSLLFLETRSDVPNLMKIFSLTSNSHFLLKIMFRGHSLHMCDAP